MSNARIMKCMSSFTIVDNKVIRDKNLNCRDLGLFTRLISLPEKWSFSERGLATIMADGYTAIHTGVLNLEKFGYLKRIRTRKAKGRLGQSIWLITNTPFEFPLSPEQIAELEAISVPFKGSKKNTFEETENVEETTETNHETFEETTETNHEVFKETTGTDKNIVDTTKESESVKNNNINDPETSTEKNTDSEEIKQDIVTNLKRKSAEKIKDTKEQKNDTEQNQEENSEEKTKEEPISPMLADFIKKLEQLKKEEKEKKKKEREQAELQLKSLKSPNSENPNLVENSSPNSDSPNSENPNLENPNSENLEQYNTILYKTYNKKKNSNTISADEVIHLYNQTAPNLTPQKRSTSAIKNLVSELSLENWEYEELFKRANSSSFLSGKKSDFKAGLVWILKNYKNILAGKYDDASTHQTKYASRKNNIPKKNSFNNIPQRNYSDEFYKALELQLIAPDMVTEEQKELLLAGK